MRKDIPLKKPVDAYLIRVGEKAEREGLRLAEAIRDELPIAETTNLSRWR